MYINGKIRAFDYLGSKYSVLPWLLKLLPECSHYVSVFGGGGSDILNRKPSGIETYNDINGKVVNFFKVLRSDREKLISDLQFTPHSRAEYDAAFYDGTENEIEQARKFFIRAQQSLYAAGAQDISKGWAASIKESRVSISEKTHRWIRAVDGLYEVAERFKHVQIECKDFRFILKNYDTPGTLFYCDPPYDMQFRSSTKYEFDFKAQDFFDLQYYSKKVSGKIAISGYDSDFMKETFSHLNFHEGPERKNNRSNFNPRECLWTNY